MMRLITLKATQLELTPAIREYVEKKLAPLSRLTERYQQDIETVVEVSRTTRHHQKGHVFRAEWRVRVPGTLLYTEASGEDLFEAIDIAQQDMRRQLSEHKRSLTQYRVPELVGGFVS